jgi:hypothetical protein
MTMHRLHVTPCGEKGSLAISELFLAGLFMKNEGFLK